MCCMSVNYTSSVTDDDDLEDAKQQLPWQQQPGDASQNSCLLSFPSPSQLASLPEFSEAGFYPRHNEKGKSYKWLPFIYYQGNSVHLCSQHKMERDWLRKRTVCSPTHKYSTMEASIVSTATISICRGRMKLADIMCRLKVCKFHDHTMRRFLSDLANLKHRFIFNFSSTEKKINTWDCNLSTEVENFLKLPVCLSSLVFFLNPQWLFSLTQITKFREVFLLKEAE